MIRKIIIGSMAAFFFAFLLASPASASTGQTWDPTPEPPATGIYIEPDVDEHTTNLVRSSFEATLDGTTSTRYTYVAKVPETWDIQTAARKTAEAWGLDRNKNSILFYDAQGRKAFIWPATEENAAAVAELPKIVNAEDFTAAYPSLYESVNDEMTTAEIEESLGSALGVAFTYGWPIFLVFAVILLVSFVGRMLRPY